jgi:hypothetical protein
VWNAIARTVVAEKRPSLGASARLSALLNLAMADAHIAVYDAKYAYNFWRPVTALHARLEALVLPLTPVGNLSSRRPCVRIVPSVAQCGW